MISRLSTKHLADFLTGIFSRPNSGSARNDRWVPWDPVYDFMYSEEFDARFCNLAENAAQGGVRQFAEFFMKLHTGESLRRGGELDAQLPALAVEGQGYIRRLCELVLQIDWTMKAAKEARDKLKRCLELDGYVLRDDTLLHVESSVLDVEAQHGALLNLARAVGLGRLDVIRHHLNLSEKHYTDGHWDDSISNARKFLECCMQESAQVWSVKVRGKELARHIYESAREVRDYLRREGLLAPSEFNTIRETYGLLSETGNHPYIAANDQARVFRQIALLYSEFVMLRVQGAIVKQPSSE